MKEIFEKLPVTKDADILFDTCFLVWCFEHDKIKDLEALCKKKKCAITSFNAEELIFISKNLSQKAKEGIRHFFHKKSVFLLQIPVSPGNPDAEHSFVKSILPKLDTVEHDPSDAVILAAGIKIHANILTRDKHDIFNARLENFLEENGIKVENKIIL